MTLRKKTILMLAAMLILSCFNVFAQETNLNNSKIEVLGITELENENSDNINFSKTDIDKFKKKDLNNLAKYDFVVIDKVNLSKMDKNNAKQLIDNGVTLMFTGENLKIKDIQELIGDTSEKEFDHSPEIKDSITSISVSNVNGKYVYSGTIDMSNAYLTNTETNERFTVKEYAEKNKVYKKHNALNFIDDIQKDKKEHAKNKLGMKKSKDTVQTLSLPSGYDDVAFNWYYDYIGYGEMKGVVYAYYQGIVDNKEVWNFLASMTANPDASKAITSYKIKLDADYSGQTLLDYTRLESDNGYFTLSLDDVTYSTSTEDQEIDHNLSYSNKYCEWISTVKGITFDWGNPYKIEPGISVTDTGGSTSLKRYYKMYIYDGVITLQTDYLYQSDSFNQ